MTPVAHGDSMNDHYFRTAPLLFWRRQFARTGCMWHTLYALTGDEKLLGDDFRYDHNFARWVCAAMERGLIVHTVHADEAAWRGDTRVDGLRKLNPENWLQALWAYPEEDTLSPVDQAWAMFALCVKSRKLERAQHMVGMLVINNAEGWRFLISDSTAPGNGVQFMNEREFIASHYGQNTVEVHAMRPMQQASRPWHISEEEMPPLISEVTS